MLRAKTATKPKTVPQRKAVKLAVNISSKPKQTKSQKLKDAASPPVFCYCSFCRKPSETRKRLIAGLDNIFICDECIEVCVRVLFQDDPKEWYDHLTRILAMPIENNNMLIENK